MAAIKKKNMAADRTISQKFQTTFFHRYKLCFSIIRFNIDWRTILVKFAVLLFVHSAVRVRTSLVCKYISQIGNCVVFREDLYELGTFPASRRITLPSRTARGGTGTAIVPFYFQIYLLFSFHDAFDTGTVQLLSCLLYTIRALSTLRLLLKLSLVHVCLRRHRSDLGGPVFSSGSSRMCRSAGSLRTPRACGRLNKQNVTLLRRQVARSQVRRRRSIVNWRKDGFSATSKSMLRSIKRIRNCANIRAISPQSSLSHKRFEVKIVGDIRLLIGERLRYSWIYLL